MIEGWINLQDWKCPRVFVVSVRKNPAPISEPTIRSPPRPQSMALLGRCSVDSPGIIVSSSPIQMLQTSIVFSISEKLFGYANPSHMPLFSFFAKGDFQLNSHVLSCTKSKQAATSMSPPQSEVQDSCVTAELPVILSPHLEWW